MRKAKLSIFLKIIRKILLYTNTTKKKKINVTEMKLEEDHNHDCDCEHHHNSNVKQKELSHACPTSTMVEKLLEKLKEDKELK